MKPEQIKQLIESRMPGATARVSGGDGHFEAIVISDVFEGMSMLKEHQMVYGTVGAEIASGAIHALSIKAYTPTEWAALAS